MKTQDEILRKIKSVKLCMMAHPDYEKDSEFEDRILDLQEIEDYLLEKDWIKIDGKDTLPKYVCECWVINRKGQITHETYFGGLGGFIATATMSIRNPDNKNTHYKIIEKPLPPIE